MKFEDIEVGDFLVNPFGFSVGYDTTEVYVIEEREKTVAHARQITTPRITFPFWENDDHISWVSIRLVKSNQEKAFILLQLENYCHG